MHLLGQEYRLALPMPCTIPAAVLSRPWTQAAPSQPQAHAAWAVVPYIPPSAQLLPGGGTSLHEHLPNGDASHERAGQCRFGAGDPDQSRLQVGG